MSAGDRDVLSEGLPVGLSGTDDSVDVVVAYGAAQLSGTVRDSKEDPVPRARVRLIPPRDERGPFTSYPTSRADSRGEFYFVRVPPSAYTLLALDLVGQYERGRYWETSGVLANYEGQGMPVVLDSDAPTILDPVAIPFEDENIEASSP
jgi:hypothetical protein